MLERAAAATGDPRFTDALEAAKSYGFDKEFQRTASRVQRKMFGTDDDGYLVQVDFLHTRGKLEGERRPVHVVQPRGVHCRPTIAELLFWRPVPRFHPSPEAFAVSMEMVELQRGALADAVTKGQLGPGANDEGAIYLVSTIIVGVLSQAIANEPDLPWGEGRFTPMFATLMRLLPAAFQTDE